MNKKFYKLPKINYIKNTVRKVINVIDKTNLAAFILLSLLILISYSVYAQERPSENSRMFDSEKLFSKEMSKIGVNPDFLQKWNLENKTSSQTQKQVRMIYLVPSDKTVRDDYKAAIADAILHVQDFYQKDLGSNYAFSLHSPIVEVYQTSHTSSWYSTNQSGAFVDWFKNNTWSDGFALTGGGFNDPDNRWIYYIDADSACGQYSGWGESGTAILSAHDPRGLTGEQYIPACSNESENLSGKYRWIGGLGHELGHALGLSHPTVQMPYELNSIMAFGYGDYPNTYFISSDRTILLNSGFFTSQDLRPPRPFDFDGDRLADISVWRPGAQSWRVLKSSTSSLQTAQWGASSDILVPGDYDGDKITDFAVWRASNGVWYILRSSDNTGQYYTFGAGSDIPVPADYDGDNITDVATWRPSNGLWSIKKSAANIDFYFTFGSNGDKPVPADYDGDKRADIAVVSQSSSVSTWYIYNQYLSYYYGNPQFNYSSTQFGAGTDKLVPGDYDGDGKVNIGVWRSSNGTWYYLGTSQIISQAAYGASGDIPTPADYDNDGKVDFAVWRPNATGVFYILQSSTNTSQGTSFGTVGDVPVASVYTR